MIDAIASVCVPIQLGFVASLTIPRWIRNQLKMLASGSKNQRKPVVVSATGAAHGSSTRKRKPQRPRKLRTSACASTPATSSTTSCEITVKMNVFQTACRKSVLWIRFVKFEKPALLPEREPAVACVKLR